MKPLPNNKGQARAKGGRASGGTRYYQGKNNGEDKMVRLMQQALDEKNEEKDYEAGLKNLSVDELIAVLELSCAQTEKLMRKMEERCFQSEK
jgi:hypothetical protein